MTYSVIQRCTSTSDEKLKLNAINVFPPHLIATIVLKKYLQAKFAGFYSTRPRHLDPRQGHEQRRRVCFCGYHRGDSYRRSFAAY